MNVRRISSALIIALVASAATAVLAPAGSAAAAADPTPTFLGGGGWGDGGPSAYARFNGIGYVAASTAGNVIADKYSHSLRSVSALGVSTCIAGCSHTEGFSGDGSQATLAKLNGPERVAMAADGTIVFIDSGNHRIRRIASDGVITTVAGTGATDTYAASGVGTSLDISPERLALAPTGDVYFTDVGALYGSYRTIRKLDTAGNVTTVVGRKPTGRPFSGYWDSSLDGSVATDIYLDDVAGLVVGPDGNLLIGHPDRLILRLADDGTIHRVAGTAGGRSLVEPDAGDGGPATSAAISWAGPLAVDGANILVATGSGIRSFTLGGTITTRHPDLGVSDMAVRAGKILYQGECDSGPCIREIAPNQTSTAVFASHPFEVGNGGQAANAAFSEVTGALALSDGRVLVSDATAGRIRVINSDGTIGTFAGSAASKTVFSGEAGPAIDAVLPSPGELAALPSGDVLVVCSDGSIRRIDIGDGTISTFAGTGTRDSSSALADLPTGPMSAVTMQLQGPAGLTVAPDGTVWFLDSRPGFSDARLVRIQSGQAEQLTRRGPLADSAESAVGQDLGALPSIRRFARGDNGDLYANDWRAVTYRVVSGVITELERGVNNGPGAFRVDGQGRRLLFGTGPFTTMGPDGWSTQTPTQAQGLAANSFPETDTTALYASPFAQLYRVPIPTGTNLPAAPVAAIAQGAYGAEFRITSPSGPSGYNIAVVFNPGSGTPAKNPQDGVYVFNAASPVVGSFPIPMIGLTWGQSATASFFASSNSTNSWSKRTVVTFTPRKTTSCSLKSTATTVTYGTSIMLTAGLKDFSGSLSGHGGSWRATPKFGAAWTGAALATSASGLTAKAFKPTYNTRYSYTSVADTYAPCSKYVDVAVAPKISIKTSSNNVALGKTVTFSGYVAPSHRGATVYLQRYVAKRWYNVKTAKLSTTSGYSIAWKTNSRTDYTWRVLLPAHTDHVQSNSPGIKLTVK